MNGLKHLFKTPETYAGMIIAVAFQFIFFSIWMTAYDGVNDRLGNLKVAVINQDTYNSAAMIEKLKRDLPFTVMEQTSIETALEKMNGRNLDMIIIIPENFSQQFKQKGNGHIDFYINQSTPTLSKNQMEAAAKQITTEINHQLFQQMGTNLSKQPVVGNIIKTNEVSGFTATMIPLMVILASFVGSMLMSLQLIGASRKLQTKVNKWDLFFARQTVNLISSFLSATLTILYFHLFAIETTHAELVTWLFQALVLFTFLGVTQMSFILFGKTGVYINILLLATQLVTSGAIVPRALLSSTYQKVGTFLPATYATDGYFNLIFGGGNLILDFQIIIGILVITQTMTMGKIAYSRKVVKSSPPVMAKEM